MFKGKLSALSECQQLPTAMVNLIAEVKQQLESGCENGRYELREDNAFFFVVDDHSQELSQRKAEIHHRYMDVQILLAGEERFGYSLQPFNSINEDFLAERDLAFSEDFSDEQFADLLPGDFIVFKTQQPHRPLVAVNQPMSVRKAVIKIDQSWLEAQS